MSERTQDILLDIMGYIQLYLILYKLYDPELPWAITLIPMEILGCLLVFAVIVVLVQDLLKIFKINK